MNVMLAVPHKKVITFTEVSVSLCMERCDKETSFHCGAILHSALTCKLFDTGHSLSTILLTSTGYYMDRLISGNIFDYSINPVPLLYLNHGKRNAYTIKCSCT